MRARPKLTAGIRPGLAGGGDRPVNGRSRRRLRLRALGLVLAGLATAAASGCAALDVDDEAAHPRPDSVDERTVCDDWMRLQTAERTAYAMHRLAEMRSEDGLDPALDPATASQANMLRTHMEKQCEMETMGAAAIWRVAHDQYTHLYDSRALLD